jgi:hypothetical protein
MGARRQAVQIRISAARTIRLPAIARLGGSRKIPSAPLGEPTHGRSARSSAKQSFSPNSSAAVRTSPGRNKLAMSSGSNAPRPVLNCLRRGTPKVSEETPMNGKVLATMMFALLPSLALAQSSDQRKSQANQSGNGSGQASAPGKNGNGSDANGATTPDGAQSDAMRPPRRRRSPLLKRSE